MNQKKLRLRWAEVRTGRATNQRIPLTFPRQLSISGNHIRNVSSVPQGLSVVVCGQMGRGVKRPHGPAAVSEFEANILCHWPCHAGKAASLRRSTTVNSQVRRPAMKPSIHSPGMGAWARAALNPENRPCLFRWRFFLRSSRFPHGNRGGTTNG